MKNREGRLRILGIGSQLRGKIKKLTTDFSVSNDYVLRPHTKCVIYYSDRQLLGFYLIGQTTRICVIQISLLHNIDSH